MDTEMRKFCLSKANNRDVQWFCLFSESEFLSLPNQRYKLILMNFLTYR